MNIGINIIFIRKMKIDSKVLRDAIMNTDIIVPFTHEDYEEFLELFINKQFTSYALKIITKVCEEKQFTINSDEVQTSLVAMTADMLDQKIFSNNTIEEATATSNALYKVLFSLDIKSIHNNIF